MLHLVDNPGSSLGVGDCASDVLLGVSSWAEIGGIDAGMDCLIGGEAVDLADFKELFRAAKRLILYSSDSTIFLSLGADPKMGSVAPRTSAASINIAVRVSLSRG